MATEDKPEQREQQGMAVMSLGQHLEELRWRLILCLLAVGAAFIVCWIFRWRLIELIKRPHVQAMAAYELEGDLNYRSYFEPIVAQLKACAIVAVILTSPFLIYQIWAFVAPGLFPHERRKVIWLGGACVVFFGASVAFGYFLFIPVALRYLLGFAGPGTQAVVMISDYLTAFFLLTLALGIAFQTPVVVFHLVRWGILDVAALQRHRKTVIVAAFVVAAVITPPDPLTQAMMAVTLIILYDLGGLAAAPSRQTLKGFLKFTGTIALIVGAFAAYFHFQPVATAVALRGQAWVGERTLAEGESARLTRGSFCRAPAEGALALRFGGEGAPRLVMAGAGRLQVRGSADVTLLEGQCLADNPDEAVEFRIEAGPGSATVTGARAELAVPSRDTLRVTCLSGEVRVKADGTEKVIAAGQQEVFRAGGLPADVSGVRERWEELLKGSEKDNTGR